jgi:hypothetical protein
MPYMEVNSSSPPYHSSKVDLFCLCMDIYIHIYIYVSIFVLYIHICIYIYIYIYMYISIQIFILINFTLPKWIYFVSTYMFFYGHIYTYTYISIYTCIHICMFISIQIFIHINVYNDKYSRLQRPTSIPRLVYLCAAKGALEMFIYGHT